MSSAPATAAVVLISILAIGVWIPVVRALAGTGSVAFEAKTVGSSSWGGDLRIPAFPLWADLARNIIASTHCLFLCTYAMRWTNLPAHRNQPTNQPTNHPSLHPHTFHLGRRILPGHHQQDHTGRACTNQDTRGTARHGMATAKKVQHIFTETRQALWGGGPCDLGQPGREVHHVSR